MPSLLRKLTDIRVAKRGLFLTASRHPTRKSAHASSRWTHHFSRNTSIGEQHQAPQSFLSHLSLFVRIAAGAYVLQLYGANCTLSIGPSMRPTLNEHGDVLVTEAISPWLKRLRVGDIVVVSKPTDPNVSILKRIRGMGGDTVHVRDGIGEVTHVKIPKNHVWLQGDNDSQSTDSRHYGPVPQALVRGKVWVRVWPPNQVRWFGSDSSSHGLVEALDAVSVKGKDEMNGNE